jgi:signal transduction histidine kinase
LQYLGRIERQRPDSVKLRSDDVSRGTGFGSRSEEDCACYKRARLEARAGAEMLSNAVLSLEARLGPSLGSQDRETLSTLVGVFAGLMRLLDGCSAEVSQQSLERCSRAADRLGSGQHEKTSRTSSRWGKVSWNDAAKRYERSTGRYNRTRSPVTTTQEYVPARLDADISEGDSDGEAETESKVPGGRKQLMMYARDVARLYRAQRDLHEQITGMERSLEITEKAAAAGLLSGGVLHDVNHYLAVIRSAAELLQSELRNLEESSSDDLQAIATSAARAGALIHKFQFMSRPGSESHTPVNLMEVLLSSKDLMKRQLRKKEIRLKMEINPDLPSISGDPSGLEEVFINLLGNAIEILDAGGRIRVIADTVRSRGGEDEVVVVVEDDGPGVPAELQESLFEPFVTGREGGTGLGLYLVRRIVERHEGDVSLYSKPGSGARFVIRFPAVASPEAASKPTRRAS